MTGGKDSFILQQPVYACVAVALPVYSHKAPEKATEPAYAAEAETPDHYFHDHAAPFKRYTRGENVWWWSHKTADGKWCREK